MKKSMKALTDLFSMKVLTKKIKFLTKPSNINKVLFLIATLLVLYYVYTKFLNNEGFEVQAESLEDELSSSDKSLVMFYADWCGHCKKLKPIWDETAKEVNEAEGSSVKMIKVNCGEPNKNETHKAIMKKYEISGYPTIKLIEGTKVTEYEGERSKKGMLSFLGL